LPGFGGCHLFALGKLGQAVTLILLDGGLASNTPAAFA